jgi:hypothetical protein
VLLGPVLGDVTWSVALYAVLSLTVVRMVPVAISLIGTGARRPTLAFLGWFGPRGLASIVFAILVLEEGGLPHDGLILTTDVLHDRTVGPRSRSNGGAPGRPLRNLVRVPSARRVAEPRELRRAGGSLALRCGPLPRSRTQRRWLRGSGAPAPAYDASSRTMHRKPMWPVEVSYCLALSRGRPVTEAIVRRAEVRAAL